MNNEIIKQKVKEVLENIKIFNKLDKERKKIYKKIEQIPDEKYEIRVELRKKYSELKKIFNKYKEKKCEYELEKKDIEKLKEYINKFNKYLENKLKD